MMVGRPAADPTCRNQLPPQVVVSNTEILTVRHGQIVDAEIRFGWTFTPAAAEGEFVDSFAAS